MILEHGTQLRLAYGQRTGRVKASELIDKKAVLTDSRGYFGTYGGRFVPETLMPALEELEQASYRALASGVDLRGILHAVENIRRDCPQPIILMGTTTLSTNTGSGSLPGTLLRQASTG